MIEKFRIKQFCCCCTTRTGSLVIGCLGWMGSLIQAMAISAQPQTEMKIQTTDDHEIKVETPESNNTGTILLSIFMFGLSVALVVGIYKDNRRYMLPWLVIKFLECCILTIVVFVLFFAMFVSDPEIVGAIFLIFMIIGILTAVCWYGWICVWSFYMDLNELIASTFPTTQSYPMTEPPMQQYAMDTKPMSPPQEMV